MRITYAKKYFEKGDWALVRKPNHPRYEDEAQLAAPEVVQRVGTKCDAECDVSEYSNECEYLFHFPDICKSTFYPLRSKLPHTYELEATLFAKFANGF